MQIEEWKPVVGYEGLYEVSSMGEVKNSKSGKTLTPVLSNHYLKVLLYRGGKKSRKMVPIHRLVAEAFIQNPLNLPQVNHKDENKLSNVVSNLEWCSSKYNNNYGTRNQKISESLSRKPIKMFSKNGLFIKKFISAPAACRFLRKKSASNIVDAANGRHEIAYDHRWEWA